MAGTDAIPPATTAPTVRSVADRPVLARMWILPWELAAAICLWAGDRIKILRNGRAVTGACWTSSHVLLEEHAALARATRRPEGSRQVSTDSGDPLHRRQPPPALDRSGRHAHQPRRRPPLETGPEPTCRRTSTARLATKSRRPSPRAPAITRLVIPAPGCSTDRGTERLGRDLRCRTGLATTSSRSSPSGLAPPFSQGATATCSSVTQTGTARQGVSAHDSSAWPNHTRRCRISGSHL
jgi:hypothetical protein